ncbi:MAG: hypothetical protein M0P31_18735 [Solirubrobacteraceae bacterium]|nr:hypothetical protein [Solirubrobacteraceae bacterium]
MSVPATYGDLVDWAQDRLEWCADAIEAAGGVRPHVYRWWEPGMSQPSSYLWPDPVASTDVVDACTVRDDVRLVFAFVVRPAQHQGADLVQIETVVDAALPIIDAACLTLGRRPGVRMRPTRLPWRVASRRDAGEGTETNLVLEVPVSVPWHQHVQPETETTP